MKRVSRFLVKRILKKEGIPLCEICKDSIAKTSMTLCLECQQIYDEDMYALHMRDMREMMR
jgi:hypothetical protein